MAALSMQVSHYSSNRVRTRELTGNATTSRMNQMHKWRHKKHVRGTACHRQLHQLQQSQVRLLRNSRL